MIQAGLADSCVRDEAECAPRGYRGNDPRTCYFCEDNKRAQCQSLLGYYYSSEEWGLDSSTLLSLSNFTGHTVTFATFNATLPNLDRWTSSDTAWLVLGWLPIWLAPLAPLVLLACHLQGRRDRVALEFRNALEHVEAEEMRTQPTQAHSAAIRRARVIARVGFALGVMLLPWPPGVLILVATQPLVGYSRWALLKGRLDRMRTLLGWTIALAALYFVYGQVQLGGAFCEISESSWAGLTRSWVACAPRYKDANQYLPNLDANVTRGEERRGYEHIGQFVAFCFATLQSWLVLLLIPIALALLLQAAGPGSRRLRQLEDELEPSDVGPRLIRVCYVLSMLTIWSPLGWFGVPATKLWITGWRGRAALPVKGFDRLATMFNCAAASAVLGLAAAATATGLSIWILSSARLVAEKKFVFVFIITAVVSIIHAPPMLLYAHRLRRALARKAPKHRVVCSGWWCAVRPPNAFIDSLRSLDTRLHVNESVAAAETENKFAGNPKDIISGQPKEAATGIYGFIGHTETEIRNRMVRGLAAIVEEWEAHGSDSDLENLRYVLYEAAGSSQLTFQNGWMRDRAEDGSELPDRQGKMLADFVALPMARKGQLEEPHVVSLRLYTTSAFCSLNGPMRNLKRDQSGDPVQPPRLAEPHPLPVTMAFMYEGLKRLRAVAAAEDVLRESVSGSTSIAGLEGIQLDNLVVRNSNALESTDAGPSPSPRRMQPMTGFQAGSQASLQSSNSREVMSERQTTRTDSSEGVRKVSVVQLSQDAVQAAVFRLAKLGSSDRLGETRPASETILWRGLKDLKVTEKFMHVGGTELAPMSTTTNIEIAARYARGTETALIFRLRSTSFMNLGCDLTELSAFPHEKEYLYPSLTFLQPTGVTHTLVHDSTTFTIVEVEPSFPS